MNVKKLPQKYSYNKKEKKLYIFTVLNFTDIIVVNHHFKWVTNAPCNNSYKVSHKKSNSFTHFTTVQLKTKISKFLNS